MTGLSSHRARKRFGQNFLIDQGVIERIVAAINPRGEDNLVEIGPGQGALTGLLLAANPRLTAIELDRDLAALLRAKFAAYPDFRLIEQDALKIDFNGLAGGRPLRVVGNLPYNISTPLIFHLLAHAGIIRDMHFMLQREVVERMAAEPGSKSYGRLSVAVQYLCRVDYLFGVPPGAFFPAPKVESAIVRLSPHAIKPMEASDPARFFELVNLCFQQRRKTLRNNLKPWARDHDLDALGIDLGRRPETLSVAEFVELSNRLAPSP